MAQSTVTRSPYLLIPARDVIDSARMTDVDAATQPSDFTESGLQWDVEPNSGNLADDNGAFGSGFIVAGSPTTFTSMISTIASPGVPDRQASFTFEQDSIDYGWSPPFVFSGVETVRYGNSADATPDDGRNPRAVTLKNNDVLCVYEAWDSAATPNHRINTRLRTVGTKVWANQGNLWDANSSSAFTANNHPCPDVIRIGDILYAFSMQLSGTTQSLRVEQSSDSGTSWVNITLAAYSWDVSSIYYDKLRVAYEPKSKNLIMGLRKNNGGTYSFVSYYSTDLGLSWTAKTEISDVGPFDIVVGRGGVVALIFVRPSDNDLYTAHSGLCSGPWTVISGTGPGSWGLNYLVAVTAPNGWVHIYGRGSSDVSSVKSASTTDLGRTWGNSSEPYPPDSGASVTVMEENPPGGTHSSGVNPKTAVFANGQVLVIGDQTSVGTVDYTLTALLFGEVSSIPGTGFIRVCNAFACDTWDEQGYTWSASGTQAVGQDSTTGQAIVTLTATAGQTPYYTRTSANNGSASTGLNAQDRISLILGTGGTTSIDDCAISSRTSNGTIAYEVRLRINSTTGKVQMYDVIGAANKGSEATVTLGVVIHFAIFQADGQVSAYWKEHDDNAWTAIATAQTLTSAVSASQYLRVGTLAAAVGAATMKLISGGQCTGAGGMEDGSQTLNGIPICTVPWYLFNGAYIYARGAQFHYGDIYTFRTISPIGVRRMFDTDLWSSPRDGFVFDQGIAAIATTEYAIFDAGENHDAVIDDLIGLVVIGNDAFETVYLDRWDGAAYQNLITHNCYSEPFGATPAWTRASTTSLVIRPNGTNGTPRSFRRDYLAGNILEWKDAGGGTTVLAKIAKSPEGQFTTATGAKQSFIQIDNGVLTGSGAVSALSTSASTGSSRLRIFWRDSLTLSGQASNASRYYRVRWKYRTGSGGCGKILVCRALQLGREFDIGSQFTVSPGQELISMPYGYRNQRTISPVGYSFRLPWRQVLLEFSRYHGGEVVNAVGHGATARALVDNVIDQVQSVVEQDGLRPIVIISQIDASADLAATPVSVYGRDTWGYGRIMSEFSATMGAGNRFGATIGHHSADMDLMFVSEV